MKRIAILGGDARQEYLATELRRHGWEASLWGIGKREEQAEWQTAVQNAECVILPLPATSDGVRIHCPLYPESVLRLDVLSEAMPKDCRLLGGRLPTPWREQTEARGIRVFDYAQSEVFLQENVIPTVEGAICLAMQRMQTVLFGQSVCVVGYGRIGSLLAERLLGLGASVTVAARREESLARARSRGAKTVYLNPKAPSFSSIPKDTRVLFNTVPERILSGEALECLPENCLLIELASAPGGIDLACARASGFPVILAPGLPGRMYPETAGRILFDTICRLLEKEEEE